MPFPLSSLFPVPLSDPHLDRSPEVQLQLHESKGSHPLGNLTPQSDRDAQFDHQPSDQPHLLLSPIGGGSSGLDCSDHASGAHEESNKEDCLELLQGEDERGGEEKGNDIRKRSIVGAETVIGVIQESSATHQASGRWCDGEKAFPPKKRRSTFERRANEDAIMEKEKKMKTKMKTKMNKKCAPLNDDDQEDQVKETKEGLENTGAKKRVRGGALMEGSRCSRVNGRGWRCCQQTLVGYSLCEHHLGKGRLRSMTSVRSRSLAGNTPSKMDDYSDPTSESSSSLLENKPNDSGLDKDGRDQGEDEDDDQKKPSMVSKKRMKLGMVKARSISSLLGQTNNGIVVADDRSEVMGRQS